MRNYIIWAFIAATLLSCSKSDPVRPGWEGSWDRFAQDFDQPRLIFGAPGTCTDADVATVVNGPGTANPGTAWADGNGNRWSVATGLRRTEAGYLITWRFLPDEQGAFQTSTYTGGPLGETRLVKVDACYFPEDPYSPSTPFVEASIIFQHREENEDWDIFVWRLLYNPEDFEDERPGYAVWTDRYQFPDFNGQLEDVHPDIAYDPETGDLIGVWTHLENSTPSTPARLYWRRGHRQADLGWVNWGAQWRAQNPICNGWTPRIDIGWVYGVPGFENQTVRMVGIAYTGQFTRERPTGFNTRVNYWPVSWQDANRWTYDIDLPYLADGAGAPSIDIGPPGNPYAAIAFVQLLSPGGNEPLVVLADTLSYSFTEFDDEDYYDYSAHPSVAMHSFGDDEETSLSVSYLGREDDPEDEWGVYGRRVDVEDSTVTLSAPMLVDDDVYGYWDFGSLWDHHYGVNTSLVIYYPYNEYWMLWSSIVGTQVTPAQIHGTFGYTEAD